MTSTFYDIYFTTRQFERIVKQFKLPKFVCYLFGAMGVASIYQYAGPEFKYCKEFYFLEQQFNLKKLFLPQKFIFLSFSNRTHARNPYLYVIQKIRFVCRTFPRCGGPFNNLVSCSRKSGSFTLKNVCIYSAYL